LLLVTALDGDWSIDIPDWQRCHLHLWQRCHGDHMPVARQKLDARQQPTKWLGGLATARSSRPWRSLLREFL